MFDPELFLIVGTSLEENELWSFGGVVATCVLLGEITPLLLSLFSAMYLRSSEWRKDAGLLPIAWSSPIWLEFPLIFKDERDC